ncbi:MAG TPA: hypothetical protein VLG27_03815 [Candidatus Saccharimonadia bacterium]|nr:hypothetical protein [Candidatus Saccharimonadia bacterium]
MEQEKKPGLFLSIITLGIYPMMQNRKAKKAAQANQAAPTAPPPPSPDAEAPASPPAEPAPPAPPAPSGDAPATSPQDNPPADQNPPQAL